MTGIQQRSRRRLQTSNVPYRTLLPANSRLVGQRTQQDATVPQKVRLYTIGRPTNVIHSRNLHVLSLNTFTPSRVLQSRHIKALMSIRVSQQLTVLHGHRLQRVNEGIGRLHTHYLHRVLQLQRSHRRRRVKNTDKVQVIRTRHGHNIGLLVLRGIMVVLDRLANIKNSRHETVKNIFLPNTRRFKAVLSVSNSALHTCTITIFGLITVTFLRCSMTIIFRHRENFRKSDQLLAKLTHNNRANSLVRLQQKVKEEQE